MIAAIYTIPKRFELMRALKDKIKPSVDEVRIFMDGDYRGNWWNHQRTLSEMLPLAKNDEPVLIMTDDVTTVPDWRERWEKIHEAAGSEIYCLFTRKRHLFKEENLKRGFVTGVHLRGFYDQATIYINRPSLINDVIKWFNETGKQTKPFLPPLEKRGNHLDVVIQEYLVAHNIEWTVTVPTLFDHLQVGSSLGHDIGGSPLYIGNHEDLS